MGWGVRGAPSLLALGQAQEWGRLPPFRPLRSSSGFSLLAF